MQEKYAAVLRIYLIKFMQAFIELIYLLPLVLILSISSFPAGKLSIVFTLIILSYLAGIFLFRILKTRHKALYYLLSLVLGTVASFSVFEASAPDARFLLLIMVFISVYRGVHIANSSWTKQSPLVFFGFQLAVYLVSYFIFLIVKDFRPYIYIIKAGGILSVFLFLSISCFDQLKLAVLSNGSKKYIPAPLLKSNITISLLVFIFILVISQVRQFWYALWMLLKPVLGFLFSILVYVTSITFGSGEIDMVNKKPPPIQRLSEPNIVFEIIIGILGVAVIIIMAALIIDLIVRFVSALIKWFSNTLNINEAKGTSLGYIDEKENLLKSGTKRPGIFSKRLFVKNAKEPGWKDMKSNSEKVRFIYKQTVLKFIKMGYTFKSCLTPVEVGRELGGRYKNKSDFTGIAVLYNRAKYGNESISDKEVESLINSAQINSKKSGN